MTEEEERKPRFKVVDRRRFSAEGESRGGDDEEGQDTPEPVKSEAPAPAPEPAPEPAPKPAADPVPAPEPKRTPRPAPPGAIDFMTFVASLATTALASMGRLQPQPGVPQPPVDLRMAREYIDIIGMLQHKTDGNLTKEEDQQITRLLSELRMVFVESQKGPGAPPS